MTVGQAIEQALKKEGHVDVYGIYFDGRNPLRFIGGGNPHAGALRSTLSPAGRALSAQLPEKVRRLASGY